MSNIDFCSPCSRSLWVIRSFTDVQQGLALLAQLEEPSLQALLPQGVQDW